ncbi:aspartate aminotransferase family protein [Chloroflexota bacterium]
MNTKKYPDSAVFYRQMHHPHPIITHGEGVYLYDSDGKRYLDGSGGALVVNVGHGIDSITQALQEQTSKAAYIHATMFTSPVLENYAQALSQIVPLPDPKFYFLTSGSEAVEGAVKLARQIQLERVNTGRYLTIARWMSYHGATLGALSLTGKTKMRAPYQPMLPENPHIPPPYCYRCPYNLLYPTCNLRCANALEEEILRYGQKNISAFIAEPVSGATLGGVVPPDGYWSRIKEICDSYQVLLIADEVMTGMGRTGTWFATENWNVTPDIITIGKGAAGGYFPLSIIAVKGEYVDLIANGTGDFNHGGTYSHHAVGGAAGLAVLEYLQDHKLLENVTHAGAYLEEKLNTEIGSLPNVGDIRGKGLMWGVELVQDKSTKAPFNQKYHLSRKIADHAFNNGLIIYPGSGSVDGHAGDHFMLGPPYSITTDQIDEMLGILTQSIRDEI